MEDVNMRSVIVRRLAMHRIAATIAAMPRTRTWLRSGAIAGTLDVPEGRRLI